MENNVLLGATDSVGTYDGSGVFNPNTPNADADPGYIPTESNDGANDTTGGGDTTTTSSNSGILLYAGLALAAYFFFFKKK
jgi:hypothetical protein